MKIIIQGVNPSQISSRDRCFNYGDGCFTTMLADSGHIQLLDHHIHRLAQCCEVLGIENVHWSVLNQTLLSLPPTNQSVIKLLISRGSGGRGYAAVGPQANEPQVVISFAEVPAHYKQWQQQGIRLGLSEVKLGLNPLLAGLKHCNRLEQVLIKAQLTSMTGVDDVLVTDINDQLVECSASNLFWLKGQRWYTPKLTAAGVNGVMRRFIIKQLERDKAFEPVKELTTSVATFSEASSGFICNALMGVVPVRQLCLDGQRFEFDLAPALAVGAKVRARLDNPNG